MASWDFTIDSEKQKELADRIERNTEIYTERITDMYSAIDELGQYWTGDDYNMFKDGTEGYRKSLNDLSSGIKMYSTHLKNMAEGTEVLANELTDIIENMTKSN